jgi:outer membrane protein assembly factor BamB
MRRTALRKSSAPATFTAGLLALLATLPLLAGCGSGSKVIAGGSGAASRQARGSVSLNLKWPDRPVTVPGKVIPVAANTVVLTLTRVTPGPSVAPVAGSPTNLTVTRPPVGQPQVTTTLFQNLELGTYTLTAVAYPNAPTNPGGLGVPQASGPVAGALGSANSQVNVVAGINSPVAITMFATVQSLVVTPSPFPPLRVGQTVATTATTYDGSGNIVISSGAITFTSADTSVVGVTPTASASANNSTANIQGLKIGTTTLTAQYVEPGTAPGTQGTGASATVTVNVVAVGLGQTAWPKFHADVQNTGQAVGAATATTGANMQTWAAGGNIDLSSPALSADGKSLYIGSTDGNLYAISTQTGLVKWTYKTGGTIESSPAIGRDNTIYFGSADGTLYAVKDTPYTDPVTKASTAYTTVWTFIAGGPIVGSPSIDSNGNLYIATDAPDSTVQVVDSLSGTPVLSPAKVALKFTANTSGYQMTPALDAAQGHVYVSASDGTVYELSITDLSVRGSYKLPAGIDFSSPVIGNVNGQERLFQGTSDGHVYAFSAAIVSAGPIWTYQATGTIFATPAYSTNAAVLYVATYDNSSGQFDSRIAAVDANLGTEIARTAAQDPNDPATQSFTFTSSPALSADGTTLYVGCDNGNIYGIDITGITPATTPGTILPFRFTKTAQGAGPQNPVLIDSSPAIGADGKVYIGGFDGNVYAITN